MARAKRLRTQIVNGHDDYTNHFLSHFGFHDRDRKNASSPLEGYYYLETNARNNVDYG